MNAVVPLNITALRVSSTDKTNVTPRFAGRTAAFDYLPHGGDAKQASTGDTVWLPLENDNPPTDAVDLGIHLHWELPEHFKRGTQDPDTGAISFPHAPTRWLVVRTLSTGDAGGTLRHKRWIVESDYVSPTLPPDPDDPDHITRPAIAVPLRAVDGTPYMFMGRVVDADEWDPAGAQDQDYLPAYTGPDGKSLYLTSIGFVGAAFSGYYPDCRSVFGFWDTFADVDDIRSLIVKNRPVKFRVSYTVVGWLPDPEDDPLKGLGAAVRKAYDSYVAHCVAEKVEVTEKPVQVFRRLASQRFDWEFSENAISCTLDGTTLTDLTVPETTLCAGVIQDVVWNAANPSTDTPFLAAPGGSARWKDDVDIALGNTTIEAISALVKSHLASPGGEGVLASYEMLLDALQLGLLRDLAVHGNSLVALEQERHAKAFSQVDGGHVWTLQATATPDSPTTATPQLTLPLELAEKLAALNVAQQAYDQGRERITVMRRQLFMDWVIYVKQLVAGGQSAVETDDLRDFIAASEGGELDAVATEGDTVGLLHYELDSDTGKIVGITSGDDDTLAREAVAAHDAVKAALPKPKADEPHFEWRLDAVPAAPFWLPTDPVLAIEGGRMDPVRRNGPTRAIAVRADNELVTTLELGAGRTVAAASLKDVPTPPAALADGGGVAAALGEAVLLDPLWAPAIAAAVGGGANAAAIAAAQGGSSALDGPQVGGLFGAVRAPGYERKPNPSSAVQVPAQLTVTFTNAAKTALAPDAVAWNAQAILPEFAGRADPFLPVWLTWTVRLDPLVRGAETGYAPTALEDSFILDADAIDLTYRAPETFTTGKPVTYRGAVVLSKKPMASLTQQIERYIEDFPHDDAADDELRKARDDFANRKVMSQALGTLSIAQTLRTTIPQIQVQNLVTARDLLTDAIADAANATDGDSWYDTGFNALTPISTGIQAEYNYGPLRSGFLEITQLRIIDAFGQIMDLATPKTARGALTVTSSIDLSPVSGDSANTDKAYLPPRALAPSRVDARWLSAVHDFVESNDHPATSPVCGWIVPNHLEVSLAFYDADGSEIGSFGLEHGDSVYRTRADNLANVHDDLEADLADVNAHIAAVMRFVGEHKDAGFLIDLMATIERSDHFVQPANAGQDVSLSVLVGRPLAVTRCALSLATAGGVLPISQGNTSAGDALAQTVQNAWYDFRDRQTHTSAGLDKVKIPVRLGDLTDTDDGLVAFLPEAASDEPYSKVLSSAAPDTGANGVVKPDPNTVELVLNAPTATLVTAIVDPRAPVHVTTGLLPTVALQIPPEQYLRAMQQLAVTFTTRPVLRDQLELRLPLPTEAGFDWWFVSRGKAPVALSASPSTDVPIYGYGPRRLLEGWLDLMPTPPSTNGKAQT